MAHLPIRTTASGEAKLASDFYVVMHALAATADAGQPTKEQVHSMAAEARSMLPNESTTARMYDFVKSRYDAGVAWEQARDEVFQRYQVEQQDGYDMTLAGDFLQRLLRLRHQTSPPASSACSMARATIRRR